MDRERWRLLVPDAATWILDLLFIGVVAIVTLIAAFLPVLRGTPVQLFFGLFFTFFAPGYSFIAALFPWNVEAGHPAHAMITDSRDDQGERNGLLPGRPSISLLERVAMSVGMSFAVVPLVVLVLNYTPWGIRATTVLVSIAGVVLVTLTIAAIRRLALPPEDRFVIPVQSWSETARSRITSPEARGDALLSFVVAVTVLAMVITVGGALASENSGEQFTEFFLLTEKENGELTADEYPTMIKEGDSVPLVVGVTNQEQHVQSYTVVVEFQRVDVGNNSTQIVEESRANQFQTRLGHNETWRYRHELTPRMTGDHIRLIYLLYKGEPPEVTTMENAYREVHIWITVQPR